MTVGESFRAVRAAAVVFGLLALAGPLILTQWIHSDYEQYIWVIHQPGRCAHLGSGAVMLAVAGPAWLLGALALIAVGLTRRATRPLGAGPLIVAGAVLLAAAVFVFSDRTHLAALLGCV